MAYLDCPSCGQRATGKATRCSQCGLIFTAGIRQQSIAGSGLSRLRRRLVVAGALVALAVAVVVFKGRDLSSAFTVSPVTTGLEPQPVLDDTASRAPAQEEQTVAAPVSRPTPTPTPTPTPPVQAPTTPRDTAPAIPSRPIAQTRDSVGDSAPAAAPPAGAPFQRYARTWVSIREGRTDSAPAVRTLEPGEAVLVDSLSQGWYRVVVDGQPVGYVDRTYLDAVPPDGP